MFLVLILLFIASYFAYKWATSTFDFFEKQGLKNVKPYPFLGTNYWLLARENIAITIKNLYNQFPDEKLFGLFNFREPFYILRDPALIKQLTVKEFETFANHLTGIDDDYDEIFVNTLNAMRDKRWKEMRSALSPIFTSSKMRMMFGLMSEVGDQMSEYFWEEYSKTGPIAYDIKDVFSRFTNDVIATCAFGVKCDSFKDPKNDFFVIGQKFAKFGSNVWQIVKFLFIRYCPKIAKFLGLTLFSAASKRMFYQMIIENMSTRERNNIQRPDMINLLMQIRKGVLEDEDQNDDQMHDSLAAVNEAKSNDGKGAVKKTWTDHEIVAQCFLFLLAGLETSSSTLRYITYELATNPDVQTKLTEEIDAMYERLGGKSLTYEALQSMKYLDMVISENLRKWPPGFLTDRHCNKNFHYKDDDGLEFTVEKGMFFWIPIHSLHMDAKYFPDPERFNPERFNEENRRDINFDAYLPFGIGPRNCIGSRFALMEMKIAMFYLYRKFTFEVGPETQVPLKLKKTPNAMMPEKNVKLYLKPRNHE